jgi:hypothetical protein
VDVSLVYAYGGDLISHTLMHTETDSSGYFEIDCMGKKEHNFYTLDIDPTDKYNWTPYIYGYSISKYGSPYGESSAEGIDCGEHLSKEFILYPTAVLKVYFFTDKELSDGDSLYYTENYFGMTTGPFSNPNKPKIETYNVLANKEIVFNWKFKSSGSSWEYHSDTIVCEPFKVTEDTLYY